MGEILNMKNLLFSSLQINYNIMLNMVIGMIVSKKWPVVCVLIIICANKYSVYNTITQYKRCNNNHIIVAINNIATQLYQPQMCAGRVDILGNGGLWNSFRVKMYTFNLKMSNGSLENLSWHNPNSITTQLNLAKH